MRCDRGLKCLTLIRVCQAVVHIPKIYCRVGLHLIELQYDGCALRWLRMALPTNLILQAKMQSLVGGRCENPNHIQGQLGCCSNQGSLGCCSHPKILTVCLLRFGGIDLHLQCLRWPFQQNLICELVYDALGSRFEMPDHIQGLPGCCPHPKLILSCRYTHN